MTIDLFLKVNDGKIKSAIWLEDKNAIIEIIKQAYDEGYGSGFISGYYNGYHDIPETPWR